MSPREKFKERKQLVLKELELNPKSTIRAISAKLNLAPSTVRRCIVSLKDSDNYIEPQKLAADDTEESVSVDLQDDIGSISIKSKRIRTLQDALEHAEIDMDIWEVDRHVINKWEVAMKDKERHIEYEDNKKSGYDIHHRGAHVEPLYQVKVWLRRKINKTIEEAFKAFEERLEAKAPKWPKLKHKKAKDPHMIELGFYDSHFGMLAWRGEVNEDWDLKIAENVYSNAVDDLLAKTESFETEKFLIPLGHDFFHINDATNQTPNNKNQLDVDGRLPKIFEVGAEAVCRGIEKCLQRAPVEVVLVKGNHDEEMAWFLATHIKTYFRNCDKVTVDNAIRARKYKQYGNTLLGFTHMAHRGTKPERLGSIMAQEKKQEFAETWHHEWHVGHTHRAQTYDFTNTLEELGFRVRTLPALTSHDKWHYEQGYVNNYRAAEAYIWHKEECYVGHFNAYARKS